MSVDNPTADGGASVTERIEKILGGSEQTETQDASQEQEDEGQSAPEPEVEAQEPESGEPEQEEGPQYQLSDVAKLLGVEESALDVDEDGSIKVKTKIDGKEGAAKFNDLLKSYQLQGHVDAKAREAAEIHRQAQERVQQFEQYAYQEAQRFSEVYQAAKQFFIEDFGNVNWDHLSTNDPIGYVEKQHAYNARRQRLEAAEARANEAAHKFLVEKEQRLDHRVRTESERISTLIPEWKDEATRTTELNSLVPWLKQHGANDSTIAALHRSEFADAGLLKALLVGLRAESSKPKTQALQKMVRAAPKLVKPGQSLDARQRSADGVKALKQTIRQSGGKRGIADFLMATGKV